MIFERVAALKRLRLVAGERRWRRILHPALVLRIAMWVLMIPRAVGAEDTAALNAPLIVRVDAATAQQTDAMLSSLFRTQNTAGQYAPGDDGAVLLTRPIIATMALDAYASTRNTASLAQAANSISRFYSYLFSTADRDGDRLIESTVMIQARATQVEDPSFNALLAVDTRNLARINLELRRPMPALYWYDGARAVERAVVAGTFDPDDNYCFAHDAGGQPIRNFAPSAALPAQFAMVVGENYAERMRAHVIDWASQASANVAPADRAANAIDFMSAVDVLGGDHAGVVDGLRRLMPLPSTVAMPVERYALARGRIDIPLADDDLVFGLFLCLERATAFSDPERFRIEHALPDVRALALAPNASLLPLETASNSIAVTNSTIAALRDRLRTTSFFSPDDKKAYPGADANIAAQRLLDDVTMLVHRAENRLFEMRYAAQGVHAQVMLPNDRVVVLDNFDVRWQVTSARAAVGWKSISAGIFGDAIAPLSGIVNGVSPAAPLRFVTRYSARGSTGALRLLTLTAIFEDANGVRSRVHFDRSIYLNSPVSVTARFPQGRTIRASTIPVHVSVQSHSNLSTDAKYYWFSPAGLHVAEGNTGVIHLGVSDSAAVTLHVEIPSPCRPGLFPFTLKFFAGDREAGTIASSLFKPYQWTYVGPFAPDGGLAHVLPPEQGVNLLQSYPGPNGSARWRPVPESACDPRGGIALQSLADDNGVHYLYTIIACAYETQLKARLWSNAPATLFINGRRVATVASANGDSAIARVQLDPDKNHILIKLIGDRDAKVSFALGDDDNLAADEFDNNLAELAGGYRELTARELATGSAPTESRRLITLRFQDAEAGAVAVVGSFNGWSPAVNPMQKRGDSWELTLSLLPGKYSYRFLVDQKKQVLDPTATGVEPDGYGGKNSVLVVKQ